MTNPTLERAARAVGLALALKKIASHETFLRKGGCRTEYQIGHDNAGTYAAGIASLALDWRE